MSARLTRKLRREMERALRRGVRRRMSYVGELEGTQAVEAASENDRDWFEANPRRSHRLRAYLPGEMPLPGPIPKGHRALTVVRQLAPGLRLRNVFYVLDGLYVDDAREELAAAFFELWEDGYSGAVATTTLLLERMMRQREQSDATH